MKRSFMDAYNELGDLLESCLPRTKRFWKRADMLLLEQDWFLQQKSAEYQDQECK